MTRPDRGARDRSGRNAACRTTAVHPTATVQGSYYAGYVYRNNTITFNRGSELYLGISADTMRSWR
jgi:hypothetical protein